MVGFKAKGIGNKPMDCETVDSSKQTEDDNIHNIVNSEVESDDSNSVYNSGVEEESINFNDDHNLDDKNTVEISDN